MYSLQLFLSRSRRLVWSIVMGMSAAFVLLFVLYSTTSAALIASGAGGCGNFDDGVRKVKDGGTIFQMLPAKDTNSVVITRDVRLSGGWAPTVNCDEANQRFTDTQSFIQHGFVYSAPQQLSELNENGGSVLRFDLDSKRIVVENMLIQNNGSGDAGAGFSGVISNSSSAYLKNVTFQNNDSDQDGGAIYWMINNDSHALMEDVIFDNNSATGLGGAISITVMNNSSLTIDRGQFLNNDGDSGGVEIYVDETSEVVIMNSLFDSNRTTLSTQDGGGGRIFINGGRVTIMNTDFTNNDGGADGGGLYVELDGGELTLQDVLFDNNEADGSGNGLYAESVGSGSATLDLINVMTINNSVQSVTSGSGSFEVTNFDERILLPVGMNNGAVGTEYARITDITLDASYNYVVEFETNYETSLPGMHVHFFFDTVAPENAGVGGPNPGPWFVYAGGSPFTGYDFFDRPFGAHAAERMCILVANPDHTVRQGTGNCVRLP